MLFSLIRLRDHGALIPRYRQAFIKRPVGELALRQEYAKSFGRHLTVARLLDPVVHGALEGVPPIYDATVLEISSERIVISGFERLPDDLGLKFIDCAQTWEATIASLDKQDWSPQPTADTAPGTQSTMDS